MVEYIDAAVLRRMFLSGVSSLEAKKAWINELNVFPVPDGDTGTNMSLTLMSAVKEIQAAGNNISMSDICSKISMGTLRGARGNSGVITSQLCRGFARVAGTHDRLDKPVLAEAMSHAVTTAYKAVMKPKEGTILTVAKASAVKANELSSSDISLEDFFREILKFAEETLKRTPDMLPVLKEAGVVDSGGQGLVELFKGFIDGYLGKETEYETVAPSQGTAAPAVRRTVDSSNIETSDIKFGYCTEFIILAEKEFTDDDENELKTFLSSIGDSLVVVAMDGIVKVHVHTNHPGQAFEKGLTYGQLTSMKVDNMREEHNEKVILEADRARAAEEEAQADESPRKEAGFVAVCAGEGLIDIYKELNIDRIVEGGQTMNPSTEDILCAIEKVNADTVFVFPNNGNIIMAANQAAQICEDRNVVIIPTKSVVQGITALISYDSRLSAEENTQAMTEAIGYVKTAEVTYAVRDTELYGKAIRTGDYMGIGESRILAVGPELEKTAIDAILELADEDAEIITIYYGADVNSEDAQKVADAVSEALTGAEVELVFGGQPVYYYFISVE